MFRITRDQGDTNQTHSEIPSHTTRITRMGIIKNIPVGKDLGRLEHCWWECKMVYPLENLAGPQMVNREFIIWSSYSTPSCLPPKRNTYIHTKTSTWMFTTALFIIAKNWKHSKWPPTGKYLNKMWYIHTMGYYLTMKRNEVLIHATV